MKPIPFRESNRVLKAPSGMEDECGELHVYTDGESCVSCWQPTWRERLSILLFGRVWLWVVFGRTQPPVALAGWRTAFEDER